MEIDVNKRLNIITYRKTDKMTNKCHEIIIMILLCTIKIIISIQMHKQKCNSPAGGASGGRPHTIYRYCCPNQQSVF